MAATAATLTPCGTGLILYGMARDLIHDAVKNALVRDGWTITDDPYYIKYEEVTLAADLGAERTLAAERGEEKIVVEIKSFVGRSRMQDLKEAVGQYLIYKGFLEVVEPERKLYLAVNDKVYEKLFSQKAVELIMKLYSVSIIAIDVDSEEIVTWTSRSNIANS